MAEMHTAEIRWTGSRDIVERLMEQLQAHPCTCTAQHQEHQSEICIVIEHKELQALRDLGDEIFILLAELVEQ
jgi:hypothetical protein